MVVTLFLLTSAACGTAVALYFVLVLHEGIQPDHWLVPPYCRMDKKTCLYVLHTREARVIGVPNAWLGLVFYVVVLLFITLPDWYYTQSIRTILLALSVAASGMSVYLLYSLLFRLRTRCRLCMVAHIINFIILVSFIMI